MFSIFVPRYVKEGRAVLKHARKILDYKRDLLAPTVVEDLEHGMESLRVAISKRDRSSVEAAAKRLDALYAQHIPLQKDAGWRENCEVILVAIVIAIGVRTFYLQPFTIPTGSMQPTLNGIIGHETADPPPNILRRVAEMIWFGRGYVNVIAKSDDEIMDLVEQKRFVFFTVTTVVGQKNTYSIRAPRDVVARDFHVVQGNVYREGSIIARGYVNAGDHVFVDKIGYNILHPRRADVFVFNTQNIATGGVPTPPQGPSQFYIKRLAGLPGDELRIDPPNLYVNGSRAQEPPFRRVMAAEDGYRGYDNGPIRGFLTAPDDPKRLPPHEYFALGDNSKNSADSRYWGTVPGRNLMGRGAFVYWPFGAHWGPIR